MKTLRYLRRDIIDLLALIGTLTATIYYFVIPDYPFAFVMLMVSGFIFRSIMWMGQMVDYNTYLKEKLEEQK